MITEFILPAIFCAIFASIILIIVWHIYKKLINIKYVKSFVDYVAVLDYNMNKAYEIIHKDSILTYSLDAMRIKDEEVDVVSQNFATLTIKLIGPTLHSEFVGLYGDEDTFMFNLIEYFNTRYEDDEIRKESLSNISNEKPEEQINEATP